MQEFSLPPRQNDETELMESRSRVACYDGGQVIRAFIPACHERLLSRESGKSAELSAPFLVFESASAFQVFNWRYAVLSFLSVFHTPRVRSEPLATLDWLRLIGQSRAE